MKGRTYRYFDDALFPFGYGLSYTTFNIGDATCTANGSDMTITVPVTNAGQRDGTEIVQLYVRSTGDADAPLKTLRAFQRVTVKAGQTATATLKLNRESFEFWDATTNSMRSKPGQYELLVGSSSRKEDLKSLIVNIK